MLSSVQEIESVPKQLKNLSACRYLTLQSLKITNEIPQHEITPELPTTNYSHQSISSIPSYSHLPNITC